MPITPSKVTVKINNQNKTMTLINGEEINILKAAGLSDVSFELLLPQVSYPFTNGGAQSTSYRQPPIGTVEPGVVRQLRNGQGEEQRTEKAVGAVLGGDNDEVGAGPFARQCQVDVVVPGDLVHQLILVDGQPVAQSNDDVAPKIFFRFEEQTMMATGRVVRRQGSQFPVDCFNTLVSDDPVDLANASPLNGQQLAALIPQIADVVQQRHQQIQLGAAPEVVDLFGTGSILDDGGGYGLHQLGLPFQTVQAVPTVGVLHVKKVHGFDVIALLPEVDRQLFKQLALRIHTIDGLLPAGAAQKKRQDKAAAFAGAGSADAEEIVVVAGPHGVGGIEIVPVGVTVVTLVFAQHHALDFADAAQFQKGPHFSFREETGGTVGGVGQDIKAPRVPGVLVAGKPEIALFGDETSEQGQYGGDAQAKGGDQHQQVEKGVEHPDTFHGFLAGVECGGNAQLQGVEEHAVEIGDDQEQGQMGAQPDLMASRPAAPATFHAVFQFFQQLG